MRLVIQRVLAAAVSWEEASGSIRREIGRGALTLVGAGAQDTDADVRRLAAKLTGLRMFADDQGRSNRSLLDVDGEALVVPQFTLYADLSRGRRPSFVGAGDPSAAAARCEQFAAELAASGVRVTRGSFGSHMLVQLTNDGPVTFVLSSDPWTTRV